nr:MAG TPA: hypothetical protein [Caudoviricetes sp.]
MAGRSKLHEGRSYSTSALFCLQIFYNSIEFVAL